MKKFIAGCLIVIAVVTIGAAAAGYYAYRWAQPMMQSGAEFFDRARDLSRLGDRIANKSPYVPPPNGTLTQSQIERFLAVQTRVRDELGARWAEIERKSAEIRTQSSNGGELTFAEFTTMFSDLGALYLDARREQVNALNVHKFSDAEYWWVRLRVYEAAGMEVAAGVDLSKIEALAREGAMKSNLTLPEIRKPDVPAANLELVRPHLTRLKESLPLAILGL